MKFLCLVFAMIVLLTGCAKTPPAADSIQNSSATSQPDSPPTTDTQESSPTSTPPVDTSEVNIGGGGDDLFCQKHNPAYHSIDSIIINHVGQDAFDEWLSSLPESPDGSCGRYVRKESNIIGVIEYFQIPKEFFTEKSSADIVMYSSEMIDAIYSGDQKQINEAFCGELAFVNDADGELYSIYWLAEHSAEDYIAADLPLDEVERILEKASEYSYYDTLAASAETAFDEAVELTK